MSNHEAVPPPAASVKDVYLGIGDFHFACTPTRIRTLLGSCVSITLWHPALRIGGMCHYMLPERQRPAQPGEPQPDGRYADEAMTLFDQAFAQYGTLARDYRAKVFGGGNMFATLGEGSNSLAIGQRNIDTARRLLARRHIPIVAEHLGGDGHRKLIFDVGSGDAWMSFQDGGSAAHKKERGGPP